MSPQSAPEAGPGRRESAMALLLFCGALLFHAWSLSVGWQSKSLPGVEYRQAQTALSVHWINQEGHFALAYPTPVLGKPWSIPMEFPLYQWAVVVTSRVTGLDLTKAGRAVSIACFYLTLPAVFLLLGRWGVARGRRWPVLALVASCPLYVFYSRAFLIETMALMFAVWFWVAFERAVAGRKFPWLLVAMLAGTGAGLVKVTTYLLYLLPAALGAAARLWRGRADGRWRTDLPWMAAAVAVPFAVTGWWVWQADQIKALNPVADFLGSAHMRDFNLGNTALRLSPELWAMKWRIVRDELTWLPLLGVGFLALPLGGWRRWRAVLSCGLVFVAALGLFPVLYAYHEYYYVANTLALLLAAGLALVGLAEHARWRWAGLALTGLLVAGQMHWYGGHYRPMQENTSAGGSRLTEALGVLTAPADVLVITGQDWNSMTAYYARRRALMLRGDVEADAARIDRALDQLADETIGALVVTGRTWRELSVLIGRLSARGLSDRPLLVSGDSWLFLRRDREAPVIAAVRNGEIPGVAWAPGAEPAPEPLAGRWREVAELPAYQRALFAAMRPAPVRFYSSFEPSSQRIAQAASFNAHPTTRLVFRLGRGAHVLRLTAWFNPDAYNGPAAQGPTDGVELRLSALSRGGEERVLATRRVDPTGRPADRGPVPVEFEFSLEEDGEVELLIGPGSDESDTRDWVWLRGPLVIE